MMERCFHHKSKRFSMGNVFAGIIIVCLLLTGCGLGGGNTDGKTEVVFWQPDVTTWQPMYQKLATMFMDTHPDIRVKVVNIPEEGYVEKLNTAFAGNSGPDMWVGFYAIDEYKRGYIQQLDEFIERDNWDMDQYFQPAVNNRAQGEDGKYYGLPRDVSMSVVIYNKDLFDTYNVAYPQAGWTLEDFRNTAKALTHAQDNVYGTDITHALFETPLPWNNGVDLYSDDGWTAQGYLDSPKMIDYLQEIQDMVKDGSVVPSKMMETMSGEYPAFVSQAAAMSAGALWGYSTLKDLDFNWGAVPYPVGEAEYSWVDAVPYHMNASSRNKDATWEFMKFMSGPEAGVEIMKEMTWASPVIDAWRESGLEDDEKLSVYLEEGTKTAKLASYLRNSTVFDVTWGSTLEDGLNEIFDPLDGRPMADPAQKLMEMAQAIQEELDNGKSKQRE